MGAINKKDINKRNSTWHPRPKAKAPWIDQLKRPMKYSVAGRTNPRSGVEGETDPQKDGGVEDKYCSDGRSTYDIYPELCREVKKRQQRKGEDDEFGGGHVAAAIVADLGFTVARHGGTVASVSRAICHVTSFVFLHSVHLVVFHCGLPLFHQIQRKNFDVVNAEKTKEVDVHAP
eukprot:CCRYP_003259-RB/>CCRYP_003259-RB protein AED:0.38 eAED:0.55 QI:1324/0/0/1/0/0/2/0/174